MRFGRFCACLWLGGILALAPLRPADSAEPATQEELLRQLVDRLEALEEANAELREEVNALRSAPGAYPDFSEPPLLPPASAEIGDPAGTTTTTGRARVTEAPQLWMSRSGLSRVSTDAAGYDDSAIQEQLTAQATRLDEIERGWKLFEKKAGEKTYPTVTVNGVFQADVGWFHQDAANLAQYGRIQDGADFRRFRLSAKGSVTDTVNYFAQVDFGFFGRPSITDLWVEQTQVPLLGNVRIGQWKQPFSLEVVSSFRYTTFMERSVLFQPFTPFRHIGVGFYNYSEDLSMTWAASGFRSGQDQFAGSISTDGGWGTSERFTLLPYWENDGEDYLHLGVAHFFNAPPRDSINFRTIPEIFIGANAPGAVGTSGQPVPGGQDGTPFFVATGPLNVSSYNVVGTELLWVAGPLSVQSEAMVNFVNQGAANPSVALPGAYAQVGYFLTGEHRPYDRKAGAIDRVKPHENFKFGPCCHGTGWGAWEVAARYSYIDLTEKNIAGGTLTDYTLGVNWYWNPYTKLVFNYVHALPNPAAVPGGQMDAFAFRAQVDF
jgi:phosphate-selective porin OprO/OprP